MGRTAEPEKPSLLRLKHSVMRKALWKNLRMWIIFRTFEALQYCGDVLYKKQTVHLKALWLVFSH